MNRLLALVAIIGVALLSALTLHAVVSAQETAPMTEEHIERIRRNCVKAQTSLNQLHASDALLRVNRGQLYESISTKLMVPFNSRIALNRLDSRGLPAIASQYEKQLAAFRLNYQQYEETMSATLKLDCTKQPVAFYDSVNDTRTKRYLVHTSTTELHQTIEAYKAEFEVFASKFQEGAE